jgi:hypothetical protein
MRAQESGVVDFADEVLKVADDTARENQVGDPSGRLCFPKQAAQGLRKHGRNSACEVGRPRRRRGCGALIGLLGILAIGFADQRRHGVASGPGVILPGRVQAERRTPLSHVTVPHRRSPVAQKAAPIPGASTLLANGRRLVFATQGWQFGDGRHNSWLASKRLRLLRTAKSLEWHHSTAFRILCVPALCGPPGSSSPDANIFHRPCW